MEMNAISFSSRHHCRGVVATAFVAATALWVVAPFLRLYVTHLSNDRFRLTVGDGRQPHPTSLFAFQLNLPNYGVVFVAAAVATPRPRSRSEVAVIYRAVFSSSSPSAP